MGKEYSEDEVRHLLASVNIFDRQFGAENCFYELFDAGHQLGVCVSLPGRRHAVRFKVGDDESRRTAWDNMLAWDAASSTGPGLKPQGVI